MRKALVTMKAYLEEGGEIYFQTLTGDEHLKKLGNSKFTCIEDLDEYNGRTVVGPFRSMPIYINAITFTIREVFGPTYDVLNLLLIEEDRLFEEFIRIAKENKAYSLETST